MESFGMQASVSIREHVFSKEFSEAGEELGRQIQRGLLPTGRLEAEGVEIKGKMETAEERGGDYYDYIGYGGDRVSVVVADVSGKGLDAGIVMGMDEGQYLQFK